MEIHLINLIYFLLAFPVIIVLFIINSKLNQKKEQNHLLMTIILSVALFFIRLFLVIFGETIGIMPYLVEDVLFYGLLTLFGLLITWYYLTRIEKLSFEKIGWTRENVGKNILYGLLGFIPLVLMIPLIVLLANIEINYAITTGKVIVGLGFAILGAFYEEIMFRGIIQNNISYLMNQNKLKTVLITAFIFTLTHIFYLPFSGFGIFYIFVFIMALILSYLRIIANLLACAILHGGIVFILIIFV